MLNKLMNACSIMLLQLFIINSAMAQAPDALDVCGDSVDRIATLLSRFPNLALQHTYYDALGDAHKLYPLLEVLRCNDTDSSRRYQITELLLKYGANPNSHDIENDQTPLGTAPDSALAELLIKNGAKVDEVQGRSRKLIKIDSKSNLIYRFVNGTGTTPLFWSTPDMGSSSMWTNEEFNYEVDVAKWEKWILNRLGLMRALLRHGANPNANDVLVYLIQGIRGLDNGKFDRYAAVIPECAVELVKALVEAGAPVNSHIDFPAGITTPLSAAVEAHWSAAVDYLIAKGADINFRDRNGDPILFHAIKNKQYDEGSNDESVIYQARLDADNEIISILRSHGAKEK